MQENLLIIHELFIKFLENNDDLLIRRFFDVESEKILDEKIEVLTALINGKTPSEIPNYYKVLELYPKGDWD